MIFIRFAFQVIDLIAHAVSFDVIVQSFTMILELA
jgi:hypothetical protein